MKIERTLARLRSGLALPVVAAMLYVGLVRLALMPAWSLTMDGAGALPALLAQGPLTPLLLTVNLLWMGYLAAAYLGRRREGRATAATAVGFAGAVLLLAYLSAGLL